MRRYCELAAALAVGCVVGWMASLTISYAFRTRYDRDGVAVVFTENGRPQEVHVHLIGAGKRDGIPIGVRNNSGWSFAVTDACGIAVVAVGEQEIDRLTVGTLTVFQSSHAYTLNHPSVEHGQTVMVFIPEETDISTDSQKVLD